MEVVVLIREWVLVVWVFDRRDVLLVGLFGGSWIRRQM
jgi:hypothetical protein